jgi:hypothetical protein
VIAAVTASEAVVLILGFAGVPLLFAALGHLVHRPRRQHQANEAEYAWSGRALRVNNTPVQTRTRRRTDEQS